MNLPRRRIGKVQLDGVAGLQPCDIDAIAINLRYAVNNVLEVLEMIPPLPPEQARAAWARCAEIVQDEAGQQAAAVCWPPAGGDHSLPF